MPKECQKKLKNDKKRRKMTKFVENLRNFLDLAKTLCYNEVVKKLNNVAM